jgi:hypothetical protein
MRAEIRVDQDSPWQAVGSAFPNSWFDPLARPIRDAKRLTEGKEPSDYDSFSDKPTSPEPYGGRNYTLFAALSDVRNGFGFAGVDTGDPIPPSPAAGRGLPEDVALHIYDYSDYEPEEVPDTAGMSVLEQMRESFVFGEHSQGWISLAELLDYDWDYGVTHRGIVGKAEFKAMRSEGRAEPKSWCGGISGAAVTIITEEQAGHIFNDLWTHVRMEWSHSLREDVQGFLDVVDQMRHWGNDYERWHRDGNGSQNPKATMHDPSCIRLVLGYDS